VVGGGVVGCAIARDSAAINSAWFSWKRKSDVARGTSGKNSGVVHTGFNVPKGSLKARAERAGRQHVRRPVHDGLNVPFQARRQAGRRLAPRKHPIWRAEGIGDANGVPPWRLSIRRSSAWSPISAVTPALNDPRLPSSVRFALPSPGRVAVATDRHTARSPGQAHFRKARRIQDRHDAGNGPQQAGVEFCRALRRRGGPAGGVRRYRSILPRRIRDYRQARSDLISRDDLPGATQRRSGWVCI